MSDYLRITSHDGKVPYFSRRAAKRVASRLRRLNIDRRLQPYRCRFCTCWHLGHPPGLATHVRNRPRPANEHHGAAA
ncbi:hypothetical protein [Embleya sp. NPDC059237]|uniref:hypothetical protein n=1 Tax=Embleya sp. NPDC059237 TaxID=3346784 RepID=UPI0036C7C386